MGSVNLRALRGDVSVLELARRSGVARNTIAALERGDGNPTVDTLYALADALGVAARGAARGARRASVVVRAGEGAHVEGAALDAHLIDRFERPGRVRRALRDPLPRGRGAREAPPHPFGVEERLHICTRAACASGRPDAPVELGPGDYASYSGSVPHIYEALDATPRAPC